MIACATSYGYPDASGSLGRLEIGFEKMEPSALIASPIVLALCLRLPSYVIGVCWMLVPFGFTVLRCFTGRSGNLWPLEILLEIVMATGCALVVVVVRWLRARHRRVRAGS